MSRQEQMGMAMASVPPYLTTHRLYGQVLREDTDVKCRAGHLRRHVFYRVVTTPRTGIMVHIWIECHSLRDWFAYCCLYDCYGQIVDPSKDTRFSDAFARYFGHCVPPPAWVNCEFACLSDLVSFLHDANI